MDDATASIELAMSVIGYFDLSAKEAKNILVEISEAVASWKKTAKQLGINSTEITRMASAFQISLP